MAEPDPAPPPGSSIPRAASTSTDTAIARALIAWHEANARDLPWRDAPAGRRDPYRVLVSELMLQQTQVARVIDKYTSFLARFPTASALASADEAHVLAEWSGLGYYRRARFLHAAAIAIVEEHAGVFPPDPAAILALPGVGRYTAGAIASIAYDRPEPIVDGNVARVVLRLEGRDESADNPAGLKRTWARADALVRAADSHGAFNESIMELGATVCTPRTPRCARCPIAEHCDARRTGRQDEIPRPKPATKRSPLYITAVLAIDAKGRRLVERRPETGLWAGMHQPPSLERDDRFSTTEEIDKDLGLSARERVVEFPHQTTHRDVRFRVLLAENARATTGRGWQSKRAIADLALGTPHRRILLDLDPDSTQTR